MDAPAQQLAQLERSIESIEAQRAILGDAVVDATVAALRAQLAALQPRRQSVLDDADAERRVVTVMFADVSGFTTLAEAVDAEHLRTTVNACFSRLTPVIQRYGGTIDKFVGDEIMALFGAPIAHEDDADRALRAALDMQDAIAAFNRESGTGLGLHFGINTGAVVAGGVGDRDRRDYSVMGDAVNVAARLEDLSRDGEILVGPETFRLTAKRFEFQDPRDITLKGKSASLRVHTLVGAKARQEPAPDTGDLRSPLIGRTPEITQLHERVRRLESGAGGVVAICGDAGVGKSRLAAEVRRSLGSGIGWAEGRAFSYAEGISYAMARTLLYSLLGVRAEDSLSRIGEALQSNIALTCPDLLVETYPYLARLLDLPLHTAFGDVLQPLSAEVLQSRTLRAFADYLRARARRQPLVLACEDVHWADPSSLHLLQTLLPLAFEAPLLFLLAYRRGDASAAQFHDAALEKFGRRYQVLDLQPLTPEESHTLVGHLLNSRDRANPALMAILERAEGNPFFLEELLWNLTDAGALVVQEDGTLSVRALESVSVPGTVQGVIMARVDRLPAESKTTLQTASVIGREFHGDVLARLRLQEHASSGATERAVENLQGKQFIRTRAAKAGGAANYAFKHVVTQDVAYNSLLLSRRRRLHEATGDAIEVLFPDRLDELAGELAYHYRNAGRRDKSVKYLVLAGDRARRSFANTEAVALYRSAIEELEQTDGSAAAPSGRAADLHECLGDVLELMGLHDEARAAYEAALAPDRDAVSAATRRRKWALSFIVQRRYDEALKGYALAEAALETDRLPSMPASWWRVWLQIQLGRMWVYYWQNRTNEADGLAAAIRPAVEAEGTPSQRAEFFVQNALSHLRRDRYVASDAAMAYAAEAREAIRHVDNLAEVPHLSFVVGFAHLWRNRLDDAEQALTECLRLAERVGDAVVELRCRTYLGLVARKRGAVGQARTIFEAVLKMASAARMIEYIALAKAGLAWGDWREGRALDAERGAREALDAWHAMPVPYSFDWMAAWIVVAASLSRHDLADAIRHADLMLGSAQQPLPAPLEHLTSAAVDAWKNGDEQAATTHLHEATRLAATTGHL